MSLGYYFRGPVIQHLSVFYQEQMGTRPIKFAQLAAANYDCLSALWGTPQIVLPVSRNFS
jgi:hypothetical protein